MPFSRDLQLFNVTNDMKMFFAEHFGNLDAGGCDFSVGNGNDIGVG